MTGRDYAAFSIAHDAVPWLVTATVRMALVRVLCQLAAPDSPAARAEPAEAKVRTREEIEAMTPDELLGHMARPAFRTSCVDIASRILAGDPMTLENVADALGLPFAPLARSVDEIAKAIIPELPTMVVDKRETFQ